MERSPNSGSSAQIYFQLGTLQSGFRTFGILLVALNVNNHFRPILRPFEGTADAMLMDIPWHNQIPRPAWPYRPRSG